MIHINEGWGQKLELYLDIIHRWLENQGLSIKDIDIILNNPEIMDLIESGERTGENPIVLIKNSNYQEILDDYYESKPKDIVKRKLELAK